MFFICCTLLLNFGLSLTYSQVVILAMIIAGINYLLVKNIAIAQLYSLTLTHSHAQSLAENTSFVLSQEGVLTFCADQHYQLCRDSFVLPFGCAIALRKRLPQTVLSPVQPQSDEKQIHTFVFKDSLNGEDYRRLCRIVQYQKR